MGKVKIHGPQMEEMKRAGKRYAEIAQEVGLKREQVVVNFTNCVIGIRTSNSFPQC